MLNEKGIILTSALSDSIKVIIGLFFDAKTEKDRPLVKVLAKRRSKTNLVTGVTPFKAWMDIREVYALIVCLKRASELLEEHSAGTLDLPDLLLEDEDVRASSSPSSLPEVTVERLLAGEIFEADKKKKEQGEK